MDKNTVIGLLLIFALFLGFSFFQTSQVKKQKAAEEALMAEEMEKEAKEAASLSLDAQNDTLQDTTAPAVANLTPAQKFSNAQVGEGDYTVETAQAQFAAWTKLEELLLVKFIDGNIKAQAADGSFLHTEHGPGFPDKLEYGGYNDIWKAAVARDPHSPVLESK